MFNDLYQKFIDEQMKDYEKGEQALTQAISNVKSYTQALKDMEEFNDGANLILGNALSNFLNKMSEEVIKMRTDREDNDKNDLNVSENYFERHKYN